MASIGLVNTLNDLWLCLLQHCPVYTSTVDPEGKQGEMCLDHVLSTFLLYICVFVAAQDPIPIENVEVLESELMALQHNVQK